MDRRRWIPVCCAKCRGPVLRVEATSSPDPRVEVRRRSRRPGAGRTSWAPLPDPLPVVYCDGGHLFGYLDLGGVAVEAARAALTAGAELGFLGPTPLRSRSVVAARRDAADTMGKVEAGARAAVEAVAAPLAGAFTLPLARAAAEAVAAPLAGLFGPREETGRGVLG